jgi:hypothetical protein
MDTLTRPAQAVKTSWIRNPVWDLAMVLSWVPFAAAAIVWNGNATRIEWLVVATLLFSVSHQPLTMPLVYADGRVFDSRRSIFTITPFVFFGLVLIGLQLDPVVIAVVAGVWNAAHTLQQRYGISRIYGRKAGQGSGSIERALLWSMLLTAIVWTAADAGTPGRITASGLGGRNQQSVELLTDAAPVARVVLPVFLIMTAVLLVRWVLLERSSAQVNPAKWLYLGSTTALIGLTIVSPIAGFVGYIGSHAAEYYLIVYRHLGDRYPDGTTDGGAPIGKVVRSPIGPLGTMATYAAIIAVAIFGLRWYAGREVYGAVFLTLGALHLFYDGLIWKLRRPEVARGFQIPQSS